MTLNDFPGVKPEFRELLGQENEIVKSTTF